MLAKLSTWGKALGALAAPIIAQLVLGGWWGFVWAAHRFGLCRVAAAEVARRIDHRHGREGVQLRILPVVRWTWTTPPAGWRKAIFQSLMGSVMMACVAIAVLIPQREIR